MPRGKREQKRQQSCRESAEDKLKRAAHCRRYASHCLEVAREMGNPADKARMLHLAEAWRRRAEELEVGSDQSSE
jgi:hypothetical protein